LASSEQQTDAIETQALLALELDSVVRKKNR